MQTTNHKTVQNGTNRNQPPIAPEEMTLISIIHDLTAKRAQYAVLKRQIEDLEIQAQEAITGHRRRGRKRKPAGEA